MKKQILLKLQNTSKEELRERSQKEKRSVNSLINVAIDDFLKFPAKQKLISKKLEKLSKMGVGKEVIDSIKKQASEIPSDYEFIVDLQIRQWEIFMKWMKEMESKKKRDNK